MTFKTAIWVTLSLLVLPLAGILVTVLSSSKPHKPSNKARAEKVVEHASTDSKSRKERQRPEEPPLPLEEVRAAPNSVTISGEFAKSETGLRGKLEWIDDGHGSQITNPCKLTHCLTEAGVKLCGKGRVARLGTKDNPKHRWGAALTWNLNEDDRGVHPLGKSKVKGLSFVFEPSGGSAKADPKEKEIALAKSEPKAKSGAKAPATEPKAKAGSSQAVPKSQTVEEEAEHGAEHLFALTVGDTDYCTPLRPGKNRILFSDLRSNCTQKGSRAKIPQGIIREAKTVKWKVASALSSMERFSFCVSELKTIDH